MLSRDNHSITSSTALYTNVVEDEPGRACGDLVTYCAQGLGYIDDFLARRVEEVRRPDHVDGLVVVDGAADVDGSHLDRIVKGGLGRYCCGC